MDDIYYDSDSFTSQDTCSLCGALGGEICDPDCGTDKFPDVDSEELS